MGIVMILTIINIVTLMVEIAVDPMPIQIGAQNAYALKIRIQHHLVKCLIREVLGTVNHTKLL